ncbi:MAG: tRNA (adenosine(37)-N6)-dimethylallyltransferase MiaA [Oscillospiraceae bacterium]|nr:tRNA (adenosine(37)-N6)-dimethylallyltransferase MiaA [Oscillospiraceae bacterium]
MPEQIVTVVGPTASGKTGLAIELAKRWNGEVVSCDSMQIYRGMDIGTAKPTAQERAAVPHHMIDVADPAENYSVARYVREASACVDDIIRRGRLPIVAGGTGLYHDALLAGREFASFSGRYRQELEERAARGELPEMYRELERVDPERAASLEPTDQKRVIRALEIWYETGSTMTQHDQASRLQPPRYEAVTIGLTFADRSQLYSRIDRRVEKMMADGLVDEVSALLQAGIPRRCTAMQAIGYKELADALEEGRPPEQAEEEIKQRTRQYAKRQLTWFRRNSSVRWFQWEDTPDPDQAVAFSEKYLASLRPKQDGSFQPQIQ